MPWGWRKQIPRTAQGLLSWGKAAAALSPERPESPGVRQLGPTCLYFGLGGY